MGSWLVTLLTRLVVNVALAASCASSERAGAKVTSPISLHPSNGHYFLLRDRPTVLITSGEHYGAVLNLDFEYRTYLDALAGDGLNYTRIFTGATYVEVPGSFGIEKNTLAPGEGRFISPYARSATPGYAGGGHRFDLSSWDEAYFARLKDFVGEAGARGIVVEVSLFCPYYEEILWNHSPLHPANNVNQTPMITRDQMYTQSSPYLPYHDAVVEKFVAELNACDNVFFEICNEPYFGGVTLEWQAHIARTIVAAEAAFPLPHLIAQNIANNSATIATPEASGALYNNLDFSFTAAKADGTDTQNAPGGGSSALRKHLGILKRLMDTMPFVDMTPACQLVKSAPSGATARVLAKAGEAYAVYLHGGTQGEFVVELGAGRYRAEWTDTTTGAVVSSSTFTHPGGNAALASPPVDFHSSH